MREVFLLVIHLLTTLAKFLRPGGVRAVAAESLLLKHQLLISNRSRQRAPNLTSRDRFLLGLTALFLNPRRIPKLAVILKPATLLKFHQALVQHKYRLLFSSSYRRKSGPIGPSAELIAAIVEMKRRNPRFGCPRIAQQISHAFGIEINKDVVRRVLAKHFHPDHRDTGPSWLTCHRSHQGQPLERRSLPMRIDPPQEPLGHAGDGRVYAPYRRIRRWPADIDGLSVCRMFNGAIAGHSPPKHLSSDNDPLFTFHRWRANLRVLEVDEIKALPLVPCSHPLVERLIGTIRREYLDHVLFWNVADLTRKLDRFRAYYNEHRVHRSLSGITPAEKSGQPPPGPAALDRYAWRLHCSGLFHTPMAA